MTLNTNAQMKRMQDVEYTAPRKRDGCGNCMNSHSVDWSKGIVCCRLITANVQRGGICPSYRASTQHKQTTQRVEQHAN
jgi:ribosomal protein L37AE/L43A